MINFNLEQPLLPKDMEEKVNVEKEKINAAFSKQLKYGIASLLIGLVTIYFFGLNLNKETDPYALKLFLAIVWFMFTLAMFMSQIMLKPRILELSISPYKEASLDRLHDCTAFISMRGMEKYQKYAELLLKILLTEYFIFQGY